MTIPARCNPGRLLVLVDLSWWLTRAYHARGVSGVSRCVVGWLVSLLSAPLPAAVAVAVDSIGPTWRHARTAELPPAQRYKADREQRPLDYYSVSNRLLDLVGLHGIPILSAEGWEADDCLAAAVPRAQELGFEVAIVTADKDLCQLVAPGCSVWTWPPLRDGDVEVLGAPEVEKRWGVPPDKVGDLLAIMGDSTDNIRGARGLGQAKAANILRTWGSLATALRVVPEPPTDQAIRAATKIRDKARKLGGDALEYAAEDLRVLQRARTLGEDLKVLQAHREDVLLARELVTLDAAAPILWRPADLMVGGFEIEELRREYVDLGFTALAREVAPLSKRSVEEVLRV